MTRHWIAAGLAVLLAGCASGQAPVNPTSGDLERLRAAESEALENARTGQSVNWQNPKTGHRGSVTVLSTDTSGARPCRSVQRVFNAGETTRTSRAEACRTEGGDWEIRRETPLGTDAEHRRRSRVHFGVGLGTGYHHGRHRGFHHFGHPHHRYGHRYAW